MTDELQCDYRVWGEGVVFEFIFAGAYNAHKKGNNRLNWGQIRPQPLKR